jgi:signal transduction histidine kinase
LAEPLEYVRVLAATGLADVRALMGELRSEPGQRKEGLVATLTQQMVIMETQHGVSVQGSLPRTEPAASPDAKEALRRICQEALHNVVKHASARTVRVRLREQKGELVLEVADDGAGFDATDPFPGHFGLRSMRERATKAGGELHVSAARGRGTRITARVPA